MRHSTKVPTKAECETCVCRLTKPNKQSTKKKLSFVDLTVIVRSVRDESRTAKRPRMNAHRTRDTQSEFAQKFVWQNFAIGQLSSFSSTYMPKARQKKWLNGFFVVHNRPEAQRTHNSLALVCHVVSHFALFDFNRFGEKLAHLTRRHEAVLWGRGSGGDMFEMQIDFYLGFIKR